jgi:hypothetical protein
VSKRPACLKKHAGEMGDHERGMPHLKVRDHSIGRRPPVSTPTEFPHHILPLLTATS